VYDPNDPVGRLLFNVLAMVAEYESDLIRLRTRESMKVAKAKGRLRGKQPELNPRQEPHLVALLESGENTAPRSSPTCSASDGPPCTGQNNGTSPPPACDRPRRPADHSTAGRPTPAARSATTWRVRRSSCGPCVRRRFLPVASS